MDAPRWKRVAELAREQHGVVSYGQLQDLGVSRRSVDYRAGAGQLHAVHRGVYAVGHRRLTRDGRFMAAALACGRGAVLSHRSAAALLDLRPNTRPRIHVTVRSRTVRSRPGIAAHKAALLARDITTVRGIPTTSVARTLLDLAPTADPAGLHRAIERAETLRTLDLTAITDLFTRASGHHGVGVLTRALANHRPDTVTRSYLERTFLDLCSVHSLPSPVPNDRVSAGNQSLEVDFHFRSHHLIVETDGYEHHGTRSAFERDRCRDQLLVAAGYRVLRFTWRQIANDPGGVTGVVRTVLDSSGGQAAL